jgi:hypothetical protein
MISKETRNKFIDYLEQHFVSLLTKYKISEVSFGNIVRSFHLSSPIQLLTIVTFAPKWMAYIAATGLFTVILLFFLFKGCFLSLLEKRFCKDSFTITDPFIEAVGLETNTQTRYLGTCCIMSIYLGIFLNIFCLRFYYNVNIYKILNGDFLFNYYS